MAAASTTAKKMPIFVNGNQWNRDDSKISETFRVLSSKSKNMDGWKNYSEKNYLEIIRAVDKKKKPLHNFLDIL